MPVPDWGDLLAPLTELDVPRVLGSWSWLIDRAVEPLDLSRFGDWFLLDAEGQVLMLDILEGTFEPVCATVAEYQSRKSSRRQRDTWFSEGMVSALHRTGLHPGPTQGFGYRGPPILGGSLGKENIVVVEVASWQLFMSTLHGAVKQLPEGARVTRLEMLPDGALKLHTE
jgi:hypothetical protein